MFYFSSRLGDAPRGVLLTLGLSLLFLHTACGQVHGQQPIMMKVSSGTQRLEMVVNTSRILTLDEKIPQAQVSNPDLLDLTPLSPTQVQVFAKKPGVTQVNLWNEQDEVRSIDVIIYGDARESSMLLKTQFPTSSLRVVPLSNSVVISGYVDRPEQVSRVIRIAEDYYPKVINNINIGGVQQVLLHVKLMEVSRTKLRELGFDWSITNGSDFLVQSVSGLLNSSGAAVGGDTMRFGIMDGNVQFFGFLEALRQNNVVKILAEPTLVTVSGRPASFTVGGEFPILVPAGLGTVSIEYKTFGTQVDFVPIVLGNGRIRLEVRPRVSELDAARGVTLNNSTVPALQVREVDTGVELRAGQTLALAGLVQNRIEIENKGLPYLSDLPYFGAPFRRVSEKNNEIELLIMVTPELVEAMEQHEVPPVGPGMHTISPSDHDLFWHGHLEVPNPNMPQHNYPYPPLHGHQGPIIEEIPSQPPVPEPAQVRAPRRATAPLQAAVPRRSYQSAPAQIPRRTPAADQIAPSDYADLYRQVGAQTPRRPAVAAAQVRWATPSNENPQNPSKVNSGLPDERSKQQTSSPGFIGPVGYDVKE